MLIHFERRILSLVRAVSVFLWLCFVFAPLAAAQETAPLDEAAAQIANAISQTKLKRVVVFDFPGPENRLTQLGLDLAVSFRTALAKSGPALRVEDPKRVNETLAADSYSPAFIFLPNLLLAPAQDVGADALVSGRLSVEGSKITVALSSYRCSNGKPLLGFKVSRPLTENSRVLLGKTVLQFGPHDTPMAGKAGYTTPSCLSCPRAEYSREALEHKIEGIVELVGVVDIDGRYKDIQVVKPLAYGLTQQAITTVQKWKLAPARGPDGKPAAVSQIVEVNFRVY